MFYHAIGIMSGSSLDGLDIVCVSFTEIGEKWSFQVKASACYAYEALWVQKLQQATQLKAYDYLLLHSEYGKYIGEQVNRFIDENKLHHIVQIIACHGHTVFHAPQLGMTAQLGDGATIAAITGINVVSDLRALDVALGGQGAPIVPMGEKLLWSQYDYWLNIGGIENLSHHTNKGYVAFDICPANRVLNMLANQDGKPYDAGGAMALSGSIDTQLLAQLNALPYYAQSYPKSLDNQLGVDIVYPLIQSFQLSTADALRTYIEHIALQTSYAIKAMQTTTRPTQMLITGGGAHNDFLVSRLRSILFPFQIEVHIPDQETVDNKEAIIMALLGVLRWREQDTVLATVTGAIRNSVGGAVWMGNF